MNRTMTYSLLPLAAFFLSGSMALSQPPAADPAPPAAAAPSDSAQPPARSVRSDVRRGRAIMHGRMDDGPMGGPFHFGPGGMWWKNPMVVQRLSLTPDQVKRMDDIFQQSRLQLIDLRANLERQEVLLEPMVSAEPVDMAKAQAQIDKVANARADLEKSNARMLLGIRAVLTPDQWTKLKEHHRFGPGTNGRPGPAGGPGRGPRSAGDNFMPPPPVDR